MLVWKLFNLRVVAPAIIASFTLSPPMSVFSQTTAADGEALYSDQCLICHGQNGLGDGPAAVFLDPKPRDFTRGVFKIRSTMSLPTDEDIFRTITRGIPGTLMPSFEDLAEDERWGLVNYIKTFSEAFEAGAPEPVQIPEPPPLTDEILLAGEQLYDDYGCASCHGRYGQGDGPAVSSLVDDWGNPIPPYDFTVPGRMKGGSSVSDIYRAFFVGIGGTPMPAYGDALTPEQYWALSYYVLSLAEEVPPELEPGTAINGLNLFTGSTPFQNGGPPCIGCHSVTGIGALGGGVMGPDLTRAQAKFSDYGIIFILNNFPFPVMNPLFEEHPLIEQEQADLIAFIEQAVEKRPTQAIGRLVMLAGGGMFILLILVHLPWRRRLTEVRRPMVEGIS